MNPRPQAFYQYIDTDSALGRLLSRMAHAKRLALDTEADSLHHYFQKVCLIQLTIEGENYVVDPLSGIDLKAFLRILADKPLILHGADYDLRMLRSSFDFRPRGEVFDTLLAAQLLGQEQLGLVALVQQYFGVSLTKQGQKSDWTRRPLSATQLQYASDDTRYLEPLANRLDGELRQLGREPWHRDACERMIQSTAKENHRDPNEGWRIKGLRLLNRRQLAMVREIWHWRESEAQKSDRPPFKILGNHWIIELATWAAAHPEDCVTAGPKLPRHCTGRRLKALEKAIQKARAMPASDLPDHRRPQPQTESLPDFKPQVNALRAECSRLASELGLDPAVIASRATLVTIVRTCPRTVEEITQCSPMLRWQARLLKPAIDRVLATLDRPPRN